MGESAGQLNSALCPFEETPVQEGKASFPLGVSGSAVRRTLATRATVRYGSHKGEHA